MVSSPLIRPDFLALRGDFLQFPWRCVLIQSPQLQDFKFIIFSQLLGSNMFYIQAKIMNQIGSKFHHGMSLWLRTIPPNPLGFGSKFCFRFAKLRGAQVSHHPINGNSCTNFLAKRPAKFKTCQVSQSAPPQKKHPQIHQMMMLKLLLSIKLKNRPISWDHL